MKPYEMALSVRQPWAEQILRGIKGAEVRSRRTLKVGVPFYLYASRHPGPMEEFARIGCAAGDLPTGVLVGVATISRCAMLVEGAEGLEVPGADLPGVPGFPGAGVGMWAWVLEEVRRLPEPVVPEGRPQPVWWRPFTRLREPPGSSVD